MAELPSQRNLGFLCDYFKLLPTDPRIWDMTAEQVSDLFLQIDRLHPTEEKQILRDDEFEQEQRELEEANQGVLWDDTEVVSFGDEPAPQSAEPNGAEEWEELTEWDFEKLGRG